MFLLMTVSAFATNATITGTITDLGGALVTSGQVTFSLQPSVDTTISGVTRFVPSTTTCGINASGLVKNLALSGACVVVTNTSLTPSGTWYQVCIWPGNVKTSCFSVYITGDVDITTVNPTPTTSPIYNLVDTLNNQTIAGNKTFSGTTTLSGNTVIGGNETVAGTLGVTGATTLSSTLGVTGASTLTGAVAAGSTMTVATSLAINGGTALTTTNRTGTGNLVLATSPTIATPTLTTPTATNAVLNTGVNGDGSGFKHKRVATCTTGAGANATCTTTVTWGTTFADNAYTAACTVDSPTGTPTVLYTGTRLAASLVATITNGPGGGASSGFINCIAVHD